ncbi:MAG: LysR family transcriptional regulator [Sphingomicrobium sp.]
MTSAASLNWRHLQALAAIAGHRSMSAAAEAVSLSQPALTQGLAKLERQVGVRLFERGPAGVVALEPGLLLAERGRAAAGHLAGAANALARGANRGFARPEQLMTTTQLHAYLALADAGSFVAAGAATGLSQPALHRAVRDLEQILGAPLTERRGRGLVLTTGGRRLARGVRLAIGEIDAGIADLAPDEACGRIVVGAMPLSRALVLPHAIAALVREVPGVMIDVVEGSWRELVEPLQDGVIDLMIGALRSEETAGLVQRALLEDRLAVLGRAGHPLAGKAAPSLDDYARFGWIVGQAGTPLREQMAALFVGRDLPPTPIECGSVMVIRGVLQDSDLLTLLSPDQVRLEMAAGVLAQIGPPLAKGMRTIGVSTRAGWRPTRAQQRFVELIDEAVSANIIPETE